MFNFFRKKKKPVATTADTFVEATGGSWTSPDVVAADGGSQAGYVEQLLERAWAAVREENVPVGGQLTLVMTDIPTRITSPHEIVFGLMMRAGEYGLQFDSALNETVYFVRTK